MPKTYGTRCIQIFVHTGGDWDEQSPPLCQLAVSVDIIINGIHIPRSTFDISLSLSHSHSHTITYLHPPHHNLTQKLTARPRKATSASPQTSSPLPSPSHPPNQTSTWAQIPLSPS